MSLSRKSMSLRKAALGLVLVPLIFTPAVKADNASKTATVSGAGTPGIQGKVVKSFVSLRQLQDDGTHLSDDIKSLERYLQDSMVDVALPVLIPTISDSPITLATPNAAIYSGHFPEKRTKMVVSSVQHIGNLLDAFKQDVESVDIPSKDSKELQSVTQDMDTLLDGLTADYAKVSAQINGTTVDAEQMAGKLLAMQRDLSSLENDLKTIFRVVNLQSPSQTTAIDLVNLRVLARDAHWLGTIAQYVQDDTRRLDPLGAMISDAQDQGWLVMGPTPKQFSKIERQPYLPVNDKLLQQHLNEMSQYIQAIQKDIGQISGMNKATMQLISDLVTDANSRYQTISHDLGSCPSDPKSITALQTSMAKNAADIQKDMKQVGDLEAKLASSL